MWLKDFLFIFNFKWNAFFQSYNSKEKVYIKTPSSHFSAKGVQVKDFFKRNKSVLNNLSEGLLRDNKIICFLT